MTINPAIQSLIKRPSEQVSPNKNKFNNNLRSPKSVVTREILMYFYFSVFLGFTVGTVLNIFGGGYFSQATFGCLFSVIAFLTLAKINNSSFATDKKRLQDLVVAQKFDPVISVIFFEREVMTALQSADPTMAITALFKVIFPEGFDSKKDILMRCPDILRFMSSIDPYDRELIYRHYLLKEQTGQQ